ncbi:LamG-like jellyroll fold domain-containing protein [Deinococcus koreensis]|uniref:PKD domain-containing protein n=1 Tax=Deinococcus koreensis TaxID=2054903 RepID=A0A2K3V0F7_9DEIO|nr:LamG-like jellyroll fold domain-containing protein [Deinococcus koreensis]PNY82269.1 hypothetical protein CVO96_13680 [Deinococcus koreensis]
MNRRLLSRVLSSSLRRSPLPGSGPLRLTAGLSVCLLIGCSAPTPAPTLPAAPADFNVVSISATGVTLSWSPVGGALSYVLERKSGSAAFSLVRTLDGSATTTTDTVPNPGAYVYRLKVSTAAGESPYTLEVQATVGGAPQPGAPVLTTPTPTVGVSGTPERLILTGSVSDPDGDLKGVSVDWGDGTPSAAPALTSGSYAASHDYAAGGTFTVKVTATDAGGRSTTLPQTYAVTRFQDGSRAHFVLDNSGADLSGNKLSGTFAGSGCTAGAPDRYSLANRATVFNSSGSAACGAQVAGGMTTGNLALRVPFSLNFWIRPDAAKVGQNAWLVGQKGDAALAYVGSAHGRSGAAGKVSFALAGAGTGGGDLKITDPQALAGGQWTHYAAVVTASGSGTALTFYRNGQRLGTVNGGTFNFSTDNLWTVAEAGGGTTSGAGDLPFSGAFDDIRFYGRALAPYEVDALFRLDRFPKP